jgi:hypothetical protein
MVMLNSGIEEHAVKLWMGLGDGFHEIRQASDIVDIVRHGGALLRAVLLNKSIETLFSATHDDYFGALGDKAVSKSQTNARGSSHDEYRLVEERHEVEIRQS